MLSCFAFLFRKNSPFLLPIYIYFSSFSYIIKYYIYNQALKNLPAMQEAWVIPGLGRSPGENSYPLSMRLGNLTEEPGGLQSMVSQRVGIH